MEIFTCRIGLRLIRSPRSLPIPFLGCERRLCLSKGPKHGIILFEAHSRLSFGNYIYKPAESNVHYNLVQPLSRFYSDEKKDCNKGSTEVKKPNIFQRMKQMTKDYWHILIPVHVVTSIGWILIFYTAAKNSVDVIWIMEKCHFPERYVEALRGSSAGLWAVVYALYKICTPVRYMITVGGTTLSIKYLNRIGYLKGKLRINPFQRSQPTKHKESVGKLGSKDGQSQAEPPKT